MELSCKCRGILHLDSSGSVSQGTRVYIIINEPLPKNQKEIMIANFCLLFSCQVIALTHDCVKMWVNK